MLKAFPLRIAKTLYGTGNRSRVDPEMHGQSATQILKNWFIDIPMAPDVPTATGWEMKRRHNSAYLAIFLTSAASAASEHIGLVVIMSISDTEVDGSNPSISMFSP